MMENRSFDHFLGWMPAADGRQAGLTFLDASGTPHNSARLTDFQNCSFGDPDHSYTGGRKEYNNGACDGWRIANAADDFSIGYYTQADLQFFGPASQDWTVCDRYFAGILGPTYPNRIYQHSGQTDRISNTSTISKLPTIWDSLDQAGLAGRYYFNDSAFLAIWGSKYAGISRPFSQFLTDCAAGNLAEVTYIDPKFVNEGAGTSGDDHPHADVRNGEIFLNQIYNAVTSGPLWSKTLLVINYDEWGGFYDHVAPPLAPLPAAALAAGDTDGRLGFRVPNLIVSPWSRRNFVDRTQYDHTSVLNMIEWRWGLPSLSVRDASANNLALALDFSHPNLTAPSYAVAQGPFSHVCGTSQAPSLRVTSDLKRSEKEMDDEDKEWEPLRIMGHQFGFPIKLDE
jgi:phospholipase C